MKSRVHPTYKKKYRVRNWASYDRALVRRGDITIWLSPAAIAAWEPDGAGTRGAQRKYSDLASESALTLRLLFRLPLRQAEGFLSSLFVLMGLDLRSPDHTTLSRRGQHLDLTLRNVPKRADLHLIIDSTGLSIGGEGGGTPSDNGRPHSIEAGGVRVTSEIATRATPTLSSPIISLHTQCVRAGHPSIHARRSSYNAAGVGSTPTAKRSKPRERGRSQQFVDPSAVGFR